MIWRFYPLDSSTLQNMRGSQDAQNSSSNCPDPSLQTQVMRKPLKSFGAAELQYEEACTQFAGGGSLPTGKEEEWEYVEDAEEWRVDAAYRAVLPALSC